VPKYYEMQAANNNNYNLICEKWGFSKDLSGWNIAKLVMRKLPAYATNLPIPPHSHNQAAARPVTACQGNGPTNTTAHADHSR
jgi:hypothetical protein